MTSQVYYEQDADLSLLNGKVIAILGYGAQGRAHALNLRDSGCSVVVGQRPGGPNYALAKEDGFQPLSLEEATQKASIINILLPDETTGDLYQKFILPHLNPGDIIMAAHGFNFHYRQVVPPAKVAALLVAPKGAGQMVRTEYQRGGGVPCLIALGDHADEQTKAIGLAYAKGLGGARAGVIETTIQAETECDLFGEQVVLCGGLSELVRAAFDTLVEAGYQPELAYFECMHELMLIVDLYYRGGLNLMRHTISNTAEYGDYTRGSRIITAETRREMKKILSEIQSGQFAKEWLAEYASGLHSFQAQRESQKLHPIEKIGKSLRRMMSWIDSREV